MWSISELATVTLAAQLPLSDLKSWYCMSKRAFAYDVRLVEGRKQDDIIIGTDGTPFRKARHLREARWKGLCSTTYSIRRQVGTAKRFQRFSSNKTIGRLWGPIGAARHGLPKASFRYSLLLCSVLDHLQSRRSGSAHTGLTIASICSCLFSVTRTCSPSRHRRPRGREEFATPRYVSLISSFLCSCWPEMAQDHSFWIFFGNVEEQIKVRPLHTPNVEVAVASQAKENTTWLVDNRPTWKKAVYVTDDQSAILTVPRNKGRKGMVYLTYVFLSTLLAVT